MLLEVYDALPRKDDLFEYSFFIALNTKDHTRIRRTVFQNLVTDGYIKFHSFYGGSKKPNVYYQINQQLPDIIEYLRGKRNE